MGMNHDLLAMARLAPSWFTLVFVSFIGFEAVKSVRTDKGQWTWVDGSNLGNAASITNITSSPYPGARYGATSWSDTTGNMWIFGGHDQSKSLNELWVFHVKTMTWSIVDAGINTSRASPCVHCASCSYKSKAMIFGGVMKRKGKSSANTWIFDMKRKTWTTLKGHSPTLREKSSYWCNRKEGVLWIFGGASATKNLDDMWQFSFKNLTWTKVDLAENTTLPAARFSATTWVHSSGKLYLFGGQQDLDIMSDLWAFSPDSYLWKMLKGSKNASQAGKYGQKGVPGNISMPGCRRDAAAWVDSHGNLWMFGGNGCDNKTESGTGILSDLWKHNTTSNQWTWIGGLPIREGTPFYGKKGQKNPKNLPGPRDSAVTLSEGDNFWLFGGSGHDGKMTDSFLNDLWRYGEDIITPPLVPPTHGDGLPGNTVDIPYPHRIMIAFGILSIVMVVSLLLCYHKECNIWCWRYRNRAPRVKYEPVKVRMQVPDV